MSITWSGSDATIAAALRARGVETDLADADLAAKAKAAIGQIAHDLGPRTGVELIADGTGQRFIPLDPPAGTIDEVTEDGNELTADTDYRLRPGGVLLERLSSGSPSRFRGLVEVTYDQPDTDDAYDEVVVDLVKLSIEYSGLDMRRDGDYSESAAGANSGGQTGYEDQRTLIIARLSAGVWLR